MQKLKCEVCGEKNEILLEKHHIHSKCYGGSDLDFNIAILCSR